MGFADVSEWGGLDTLHILAGVPSTSTLLELAGVGLAKLPSGTVNRVPNQRFDLVTLHGAPIAGDARLPDEAGLTRLAREARACSEVNYVGTVLALGCFVSVFECSTCSWSGRYMGETAR